MMAMAMMLSAAALPTKSQCAPYEAKLSPVGKQIAATMVQNAFHKPVSPNGVSGELDAPGWKVIFAIPVENEGGGFFFHEVNGRYRYVGAWGGVIEAGELCSTARYVTQHYGAPPKLAACFVRSFAGY